MKAKPKHRAAVINATIPRGTGYGDVFSLAGMDIQKFHRRSTTTLNGATQMGKTKTELEVMWGFGDLDKGAAAVKLGLSRGHIQEKDGLLYVQNREITVNDQKEISFEGMAKSDAAEVEGSMIADREIEEWAVFAKKGHSCPRMLSLCDAAPPSSEGQAHCEQASAKCHTAIAEVKGHGRTLAARQVPPHLRTWTFTLSRALALSKDIDTMFLQEIDEHIMMGTIATKTDNELKAILVKLEPMYEELMACAKTLKQACAGLKAAQAPPALRF